MKLRSMLMVGLSGMALACAPAAFAQHGTPAAGATQISAPDKNDVHVKQLYELLRAAHAPGAAPDHAKLMGDIKAIADAHAAEVGEDPKAMEEHVMTVLHNAVAAVEADPHALDTYDTFWATLHTAAGAPHGAAQQQGQTKSLQGGDNSAWTDNPNMHAFYDLTVATFANGADKVDLASYQAKSYAIFREFGKSMGASPEAMVDHLKGIPRQMIGIVKDDPKSISDYKHFTVALMGPQ